jgi:hypothetical protein
MNIQRRIAQFTRERARSSIFTTLFGRGSNTRIRSLAASVSSLLYGYALTGIVRFTQLRNRLRSRHGVKWSVNSNPEESLPREDEVKNIQDPNTFSCGRCQKTIWLDESNAVFYLFTVQPWVSYWMVICPNCNQPMRCFIRDNLQWEYEWCQRNSVGIITEAFPDAGQLAGYEEVYEVHEIAAHDLSQSEEREVAFFHWLLSNHDPMTELGGAE